MDCLHGRLNRAAVRDFDLESFDLGGKVLNGHRDCAVLRRTGNEVVEFVRPRLDRVANDPQPVMPHFVRPG